MSNSRCLAARPSNRRAAEEDVAVLPPSPGRAKCSSRATILPCIVSRPHVPCGVRVGQAGDRRYTTRADWLAAIVRAAIEQVGQLARRASRAVPYTYQSGRTTAAAHPCDGEPRARRHRRRRRAPRRTRPRSNRRDASADRLPRRGAGDAVSVSRSGDASGRPRCTSQEPTTSSKQARPAFHANARDPGGSSSPLPSPPPIDEAAGERRAARSFSGAWLARRRVRAAARRAPAAFAGSRKRLHPAELDRLLGDEADVRLALGLVGVEQASRQPGR